MPHEFACHPGTRAKIISVLILVSQLSKLTLSILMETNFPGGENKSKLGDTFEIPSTFAGHPWVKHVRASTSNPLLRDH